MLTGDDLTDEFDSLSLARLCLDAPKRKQHACLAGTFTRTNRSGSTGIGGLDYIYG